MQSTRGVSRLLPLWVLVGVLACADLPTAEHPQVLSGESAANFFENSPAAGFEALEWANPLEAEVQVERIMDSKGGEIRLGTTGVTIRFPEGAVTETVTIQARALAGSVVAFEFGAHGLTFDAPVQIRIDAKTLAGSWLDVDSSELYEGDGAHDYLLRLIGVYFVASPLKGVVPLETLPIYIDDGDIVLEIRHFSGYAVASA